MQMNSSVYLMKWNNFTSNIWGFLCDVFSWILLLSFIELNVFVNTSE